jgi:uncharacterized repeat protein (TIGR04138 family)
MQPIGFQDAIEKVIATDPTYDREAYNFLRDALEYTVKRRKKNRKEAGGHVSAQELLEGFRLYCLQEFGPMTVTVLDQWGITTSEDIGKMVFNLVNAGVFGATEEDSVEGFRDIYDFDEVFARPFRPTSGNLSGLTGSFVKTPQ